ncbi:hypothetical protein ACH50_00055 [Franconibacter pulveris]|uniref:Uncharacterized protein n=1 Tax=Franconibacter pulveris TaxID=435910 RepID=A0A0J8VU14_9ENTR|nr:hypothetical protein ACH50_00055 [Franconibacter pulveris]
MTLNGLAPGHRNPDFLHEVAPLAAQGRIKYAKALIDEFENIPNAFVQLLKAAIAASRSS